jgi:hypothetical protein
MTLSQICWLLTEGIFAEFWCMHKLQQGTCMHKLYSSCMHTFGMSIKIVLAVAFLSHIFGMSTIRANCSLQRSSTFERNRSRRDKIIAVFCGRKICQAPETTCRLFVFVFGRLVVEGSCQLRRGLSCL